MKITGHVVGLLKSYMRDLVEQAEQEAQAQRTFGFEPSSYRPDQALSDLLALLDDRIESEGVQVGLPEQVLHDLWTVCDEAQRTIQDQVWLEANVAGEAASKAQIREMTYKALLAYLERQAER